MLMEVMISRENFDYLVEKWYTDSQRRSFFSGVKRVFRGTCRSEPKDALFQRDQDEIYLLQYAVEFLGISPKEQLARNKLLSKHNDFSKNL